MQEHNTIRAYLDTVAEQIRWKRARPVVVAELERHLEDQRDAFAGDGFEDAEALAVKEMGDPVAVGTELDRVHRPKPQWGIIALTIAIGLIGALLRIFLIVDQNEAYMVTKSVRTLTAFGVGCIALLAGYFLDYSRLSRHVKKIYVGTLVAGLVVAYISPNVNGCHYYARYVIMIFPVAYALWLYSCRNKGWLGLVVAILGGIPMALFCYYVPYISGLAVYVLSGFVLVIVAAWNDWFGIGRWKSLSLPLACAGTIMGVFAYLSIASETLANRLTVALHPEVDPLGRGYYAWMIREALGRSQWIGEGSWDIERFGFYEWSVPNADSDAFLTTLIHKLGWAPFLLITFSFAALMLWLIFRCTKQKSQLGRLIVIAVVMSLSVQAMISVMWNMGFALLGASFPFIIGNISTIFNMGLIGLALSVFRGDSIARNSENSKQERQRIRVRLVVERI